MTESVSQETVPGLTVLLRCLKDNSTLSIREITGILGINMNTGIFPVCGQSGGIGEEGHARL